MPLRPPAGFISAFYDPLNNPNAPTIGTATAGDATASVTFTAPTNVGGSAISLYGARSTPDNITATAASSPISVTGLTNDTAYTFAVWAINSYGPSAFSASSGSVTPSLQRGIFGGGYTTADTNVIQYISIASTGNSTDFGDLTLARSSLASCASSTRGVFGGGVSAATNVINYITIATTGNAIDFGDLLAANSNLASCSSSTRGIFAGGIAGSRINVIQYITIASIGNATDFGDLLAVISDLAGCSSTTRGVFAGGVTPATNVIQYITIASAGNSTDFGDLSAATSELASCSNSTRGLFAGGITGARVNTIN